MPPSPSASEHLPLTPLSMGILVALADESRHGYGILKEIERESGGATRPSAGSLYAALDRLHAGGLIAEDPEAAGPDDDERRRYYSLTAAGRAVARAEAERLARVLEAAGRKALLPGWAAEP